MDINKIQQQLIQSLEQKSVDQLTTLSRILNLIVGKSTSVEVVSTEPMTADEQQKLQKQTAAALSQVREQIRNVAAKIDPNSRALDDRSLSQDVKIPPALRAIFVRLLDQQELLASQKLQWAEISQNGQKTTVYTDQPLVAGQKISIQLTNPQRLSFSTSVEFGAVSASEADIHEPQVKLSSTNSAALINNKIIGELLKNSVDEKTTLDLKNTATTAETKNTLTQQSAIKNALALTRYTDLLSETSPETKTNLQSRSTTQRGLSPDAVLASTNKLRDLLSMQIRPSNLYSLINQITQQSTPLFDQPEHKSIEQILKSIAAKLREPDFFQRPDALKNAFRQSGIFYESRLNQLARNNLPALPNAVNKQTQVSNSVQNNITQKIQNLVNSDSKGSLLNLIKNSSNNTDQNAADQNASNIAKSQTTTDTDDLQLLIKDLMKSSMSPDGLNPKPLTKDKLGGNSESTTEQLSNLLDQLRNKNLPATTRDKILNEIVKLIQQEAAHSLTKIQVQQFQSLLQASDSELGGKHQTQSWQLEIPIRFQNEVHPVQIELERHWLNPDGDPEKAAASAKTKQWNITLRFDLPLMGEFCAQLSMQGENVSAKLWAERENTLKRIRNELENLKNQMESDGIVVKSLQCANGLPAKKQIRLSYSLIDIST